MNKNISNKFWPFSFYLLFFAGAAAVFNFLALFFQSKGLTGSQIGVLVGLSSIVGLLSGPMWSGIADASQRHRLVLSIAILGNVTAVFLYPLVNAFPLFLILIIIQALFGGPVISMVDNAAMTMLGEERAMYGRVRLGGTIGWGLMATVMGVIVERYDLRWNFLIYTGFMLAGLLVAQRLHFSRRPAEGTFSGGIRQLLGDRKWIVFLTIVFFAGSGLAAVSAYFFVYLESIGTSPTWMGLAIAIATVAEFPALFFADRLMRRLGPRNLLILGLGATALRCLLYGLIGVPWMALAAQVLQAVTFPILLVAGVSYADQNAPPGMGATAQSIFTSAFLGVSYAAGGFFGGVLMQYIGVRPMYLVFGALILLAAVIFSLAERRERQAVLVGNQEVGN